MSDLLSTAAESDGRHRAAVSYVCAHLQELRRDLASIEPGADQGPVVALVDGFLEAFAAGEDCVPWLDRIDAVLLRANDALGLYGRSDPGSGRRGVPLAGVGGALPPAQDEIVFLCPVDRCSRFALAESGSGSKPGPAPDCRLSGRPLREARL
jgi:hypothetical protein